MGSPVKWPGNPILKPQMPWEGRCVIVWGSVLWDRADGFFKMWYEAYNPLDPHPCHRLCYARSMDGIEWERPIVGLIEWSGSKQNNIIHVGENAIDSATVVIDPFDPPDSQRFKMMLYDDKRRLLVRFASPDGLRWSELGPVPQSGKFGDRHTLFADVRAGRWIIYHRPGGAQRSIAMTSSEDFTQWFPLGEALRAEETDPPETELYGMVGFRDPGAGLGFLEMFHVLERRLDTQLVQLDDEGRPTRYMPGTTFLPRGEWGEWDSTWVCPAHSAPLRVGEELRIYYGGRRTLHWSDPPRGIGHIGAIGLARLRPDGWVYLSPTDSAGSLTTIPLTVTGRYLCINADARAGSVSVELLDSDGKTIPSHAASDCYALRSDATCFRLNWSGSSNLDDWRGRTISVKIHLTNAKLFAVWFSNSP